MKNVRKWKHRHETWEHWQRRRRPSRTRERRRWTRCTDWWAGRTGLCTGGRWPCLDHAPESVSFSLSGIPIMCVNYNGNRVNKLLNNAMKSRVKRVWNPRSTTGCSGEHLAPNSTVRIVRRLLFESYVRILTYAILSYAAYVHIIHLFIHVKTFLIDVPTISMHKVGYAISGVIVWNAGQNITPYNTLVNECGTFRKWYNTYHTRTLFFLIIRTYFYTW